MNMTSLGNKNGDSLHHLYSLSLRNSVLFIILVYSSFRNSSVMLAPGDPSHSEPAKKSQSQPI